MARGQTWHVVGNLPNLKFLLIVFDSSPQIDLLGFLKLKNRANVLYLRLRQRLILNVFSPHACARNDPSGLLKKDYFQWDQSCKF